MEVPDGAASGDVTMQIWTNDVGVIGQYKVLPTPYVHSVVSDNPLGTGVAEEDDVVTITGENFGTDVNDIEVSFNGTSAKEIRLVDESTIEAVTPRNWVSGNVVITIRGYAMTGNALFNPNAKGDVTSVYLKTINSRLLKRVKKVGRMVNGGHLPIGYRMRCLLTQMVVRLFPECNIRRRKDIRWPSNTAGIRSNMLTVRCTNKLNYVRGRTDWK